MGLADEVGQHPFGDLEIGDDTVLQRTDGNDVGGGASHHVLGVPPHGFHLVRVFVDSHDGGLIDHNPLSLGKHQRVGRAQVNGEVAGKEVEGSSKVHSVASSSLALGRVHRCSAGFWPGWEKDCLDPDRSWRQPCCNRPQHTKVALNLQTLTRISHRGAALVRYVFCVVGDGARRRLRVGGLPEAKPGFALYDPYRRMGRGRG